MPLRLTVIGTGYLGATHAACMAELGYDVLGLDVDESKVARLNNGQAPFYEPGLSEVLLRGIDSGRLRFTTDVAAVADFADLHFLCVGTPQQASGNAADLAQVHGAVAALAAHLTRPCLLVGKSTVPIGTAADVERRVQAAAPAGTDVAVAWNPEFLREGHAVDDTLRPDRLVFGVRSDAAEELLRRAYAPIIDQGVPVVVTDYATAELVKVAANAFLATKISFINAMAEVCEATGADVSQLSLALGYDPRIGDRFLKAGLGFGGGCLPKDIRAFMARAGELGVEQALTFLREVDAINQRRRDRIIEMVTEELGGSLLDQRIAVLGIAFKPDSDDVRDSPALHVAAGIHLRGAVVSVYDPAANANAAEIYPGLTYVDSADAALDRADAVLVLTEWPELTSLDPVETAAKVRGRRILDGRLCLDPLVWRAAGWSYRAPGRP